MIVLTSPNGTKHYLHPNAIARVSHAGPNSSRIGAYVKTFDGGSIEAQESADSIAQVLSALIRSSHANRDLQTSP